MSAVDTEAEDMTKKAAKTSPVRLTDEAMHWARIASGYTKESMSEYVSRIVMEKARDDVDRLHAEMTGEKPKRVRKNQGGPDAPA